MLDPANAAAAKRPTSDLQVAVDKAATGDPAAFKRIVDATSVQLFRLAARLLGSLEDAEDVLQDSYIRAFDSLQQGRFDRRSNIQSWLYRIVANAALDTLRGKARHRRHVPRSAPEPHEGGRLEARAMLREVAEWMNELPPERLRMSRSGRRSSRGPTLEAACWDSSATGVSRPIRARAHPSTSRSPCSG